MNANSDNTFSHVDSNKIKESININKCHENNINNLSRVQTGNNHLSLKDPETISCYDSDTQESDEDITMSDIQITNRTKNLCENIGDGTFNYVNDKTERIILENAWLAITETKTWDFVAENDKSFVLSNDPQINLISKKMKELGYDGHSGCSFGCTMRNMQYLVKNGVDKFKELFN